MHLTHTYIRLCPSFIASSYKSVKAIWLCYISKNQISELLKLSKMCNYEAIASYWVVYKKRDNVLSFFPVNSVISLCMFSFAIAHLLQINPLLPSLDSFFRYAHASVRPGSYAPAMSVKIAQLITVVTCIWAVSAFGVRERDWTPTCAFLWQCLEVAGLIL